MVSGDRIEVRQWGRIDMTGTLELLRLRGDDEAFVVAVCPWRAGCLCGDACPAFLEYFDVTNNQIVRLECMPRSPMVVHVRRDGRVDSTGKHSAEKDSAAASAGKQDHGPRGPWDE